jgi:hypothetical protein
MPLPAFSESRHTRIRRKFGRDVGVNQVIRSQGDVPAGVPVALKIQIEAAQRSEECNHILGRRRWMRGGGVDSMLD